MRRCFAAALLLCNSPMALLHAQSPAAIGDLVTNSGMIYKAARVQSVDADGITYFHSSGVTKVAFTDLPVAVQQKYGYDAALQPPAIIAAAHPAAAPTANVLVEPANPLLGASIAGFSREAVLFRLANGSIIGRRMEDVDAETRERLTKLLDAEEDAKKKLAAEAEADATPAASPGKPNALYDSGKGNSRNSRSGGYGRGSGRHRR